MSKYHPIIKLPPAIRAYDFTSQTDREDSETLDFGIGRYNEKRSGMYTSDLYKDGRYIHMGIDLFAPIGTPVYAFSDGEIFLFNYNSAELDYGYVIITLHKIEGKDLYVLHGHLNKQSIIGKRTGQHFKRGAIIGWVGDKTENGGWAPHVHVQLSWEKPIICDMPGVVSDKQLANALNIYPDPRMVLGSIY